MIPKTGIDYLYIKDALLRRFMYVALPFFVCFLGTIMHLISTPRIFRAQTLILIEPQKVPGEFVSSTVTIDLRRRLRTITDQIKSRTRLEQIINDFDLYPGTRASATMTDAVEAFRGHIEVEVRGEQSFSVAFQGTDVTKVRDVTNRIANLYIEDHLKLRETQASGTTKFLDRELEKAEEKLQRRETILREFKEEYADVLPEHMDQNYRMLNHLQQQLASVSTILQQTKDRKVLLDTQLGNLEVIEAESRRFQSQEASSGGHADNALGSTDIETLRERLRNLTTRYSDKHPDVIRIRAVIARVETEQDTDGNEAPSGNTVDRQDRPTIISTQKRDLVTRMKLIKGEIEKLNMEQSRIKEEIEVYKQRIERAPEIEQMQVDLNRGYVQVRENYQSLLQKKFKAKLSENLEMAQQGEQFRIVDYAKLPEKPFLPQTRKMLMTGALLSLGVGLGLGLLLEYINPGFYTRQDLESTLEYPVLTSVPEIMTEQDHRKILVKRIASATALVSMASILLIALYVLWRLNPMATGQSLS